MVDKLRQVAGVANVKLQSVEKGSLRVEPEPDATPKPRAVWDTAAKTDLKPVKLVTPKKTYTKRP